MDGGSEAGRGRLVDGKKFHLGEEARRPKCESVISGFGWAWEGGCVLLRLECTPKWRHFSSASHRPNSDA
jgi:hypothetical protein